jgi:hypothetical protein
LSLGEIGKPCAEMDDKESGAAFFQANLQQCVTCAPRLSPRVAENWNVAEEAGRVRELRSKKAESSQFGDPLHDFRDSRLLQCNHVRFRGTDHGGDLFGAPNPALPDVVGEEPQSYAAFGFFSSTRYG